MLTLKRWAYLAFSTGEHLPSGSCTFKAIWSIINYPITYNLGGEADRYETSLFILNDIENNRLENININFYHISWRFIRNWWY